MNSYFSQNGEDFLLEKIFSNQSDGYFVEVGCLDGIEFSNTYYFEKKGWKGACIEAHNDFILKLKKNRPGSSVVHCAIGAENKESVTFYANKIGSLSTLDKSEEERWQKNYKDYFYGFEEQKVRMRTLTSVFDELRVGQIDFISLDIEGYEVQALRGLDFKRYKPKVFVIEYKNDAHKGQLEEILLPEGYYYLRQVGCNLFYSLNFSDKKILEKDYGVVPLLVVDSQGVEHRREARLIKPSFFNRLKFFIKKTFVGKLWINFRKKKVELQKRRLPSYDEKRAIINEYRQAYGTSVFVETGTFFGDTVEYFKSSFNKVVSIELAEELAKKAKVRFAFDKNVTIIQGDSASVLPEIISSEEEAILFWLDGHYSSEFFVGDEFVKTAKGEKETPVVEELVAVFQNTKKKPVVLIDDARCFTGDGDYPSLSELRKMLRKIAPDFAVTIKRDIIRIVPNQ